MPELPEVTRIVDQLNEVILNKSLLKISILSGRYQNKTPEGLEEFSQNLPIQITEINNKGKFIYFKTSSEWNIWNILGMTGGWSPKKNSDHTRLVFEFENNLKIYFTDIRNFGTLKFVQSLKELKKKLNTLGPDILKEEISDQFLKAKLISKSSKTLAEFLMDQKNIAGVGNYIKAEALYLSKLSPHRLAGSLAQEEISLLNRAIHAIVEESYKSGGSTFRTYADFNGDVGTFSSRFMVYGKTQDPLGNKIKKEETKDKRTTFWVPEIQK